MKRLISKDGKCSINFVCENDQAAIVLDSPLGKIALGVMSISPPAIHVFRNGSEPYITLKMDEISYQPILIVKSNDGSTDVVSLDKAIKLLRARQLI